MKRAHKFNARPTTVDGITFASAKESRRYAELKLLERAGQIRNLRRQTKFPIVIDGRPVKYPNGRIMTWTADADYFQDNEHIVEDVKGVDTRGSKMLRTLVEHIYKLKIRIV